LKYATEIDFSFNNTMTIFIDNIKENSVVLEFGPASGRLTRYLKNEKNCKVYIVELDEEAGLIAAKDAEDYVIGDIQDYEWTKKFSGIKFDYILFADVLEHLTQAEKVVKAAAKMLKDGGKMCISVPNIAHNSVIINLLKNRFEYTSTGIMDNTHVHFYTKESLSSKKLAISLQTALRELLEPENDREALLKSEDIIITKNCKVTTAIVECGFLSNQEEEKKLVDDSYQTKIAEAIKAGIDNYFTVMAPKE